MEVFFLVFWGVLVSRSLVCSVPGGDCCFFSLPSFLLFLFLLFGSVEPQGVCWDICGLVSLATPQYKHVYTNHTVRASRPVPTLTIRYVIRLISGSSVRAGVLYLQQVMSLADLSLLLSVSICASSLSLWVIWVIWGLFVLFAPICISGRDPSVFFEMICIEKCLCIVSLICGAYWASAHCSALISVSGVLRFNYLHSGISTLWCEDQQDSSPIPSFSFRHHRHHHLPHSYNITLRHNRAKWWLMSRFSVINWSTIYSLLHGPYALFSNCAWGCHSYWSTTLWLLLPYRLS